MKRYFFFLLAVLFCAATTTFAQEEQAPRRFAPIAKATADEHGIIREQPEGELRYYLRSGNATYASYYFMKDTQEGMAAEIVFAEDNKVYIKNIISHAATGTWVEGTRNGNTITVPLGQMIYWWDQDENGASNYGLVLARVKVKESISSYTSTTKGSVTFAIEGDDLVLQGTSGDPDSNTFDGLGLVYNNAYEGEWSYYLDYETKFTYKDVQPVRLPEGIEPETYSMEADNSGHFVRVAFNGSDVYVQGVSERVADAWMKGTLKNNKITFPLQYAGLYSTYMLFFNAANGDYRLGDNGYWDWYYTWTDGNISFEYDPRTRAFGTNMSIIVSNSDTDMGRGEIFHAPFFRPYKEKAGTPADPAITYHQDMGNFTVLMLSVPLLDTEGNFLDPSKVSYRLYLSDDEPFVLYPDEYKYLSEEMEEIPYLFTDETRETFSRSYIYEKASYIYIFQKGIDQMGIQSIYRGGGEEHRSKIVYRTMTRVSDIDASRKRTIQNYDLNGRPVSSNYKGLVISRQEDGAIVKYLQK